MLIVALTGGIGCGKSAAAQAFAALGALTIDADTLAREAIEKDSPGFHEVVARFGGDILTDGEINRGALAAKVFSDATAKEDLEKIVHPRVQALLAAAIARLSPGDVLIYEIPLLVETGAASKFDYIITVEAPMELRLARLMERGLTQEDARARIARQATREQREEIADYVIDNTGDKYDLAREVEKVWVGELLPRSVQ